MSLRRLGELAEFVMGQAPPGELCNSDGIGMPFVKAGEFSDRFPVIREWTTRPLKRSKRGDVLVCVVGATSGKVNQAIDSAIGRSVAAVRPNAELLDTSFLFHFLRTKTLHLRRLSQGAAQGVITREMLDDLVLSLPRLEEQRRIAAILDQAEALRAMRRQALAKLDTLTQSLFVEMFGDPIENDRLWPFVAVGDFVSGFETGKSLSATDDSSNSTFKILKISAVTKLEFDPEEVKPLPSNFVPSGKEIVRAGDLLFSRANTSELIGATAYVYSVPDNLVLPDKLWRFVWKDENLVDPLFVWHLFRQASVRREISSRGTGSSGSMKNISQGKVLDIKLGFPPIKQQREFANRLRVTDRVRNIMTAEISSLDRMSKSLQHRAFRGEL